MAKGIYCHENREHEHEGRNRNQRRFSRGTCTTLFGRRKGQLCLPPRCVARIAVDAQSSTVCLKIRARNLLEDETFRSWERLPAIRSTTRSSRLFNRECGSTRRPLIIVGRE